MKALQEDMAVEAAPAFPAGDDLGDRRAEVVPLDRVRRSSVTESLAESAAIRVVVADGHSLVRAGIRVLLEGAEHIAVVGEATTGEEAVAVACRQRPDVVLLDASLPGIDGLEATRRITVEAGSEVIVLTGFDHDEWVFAALRAGARGLLPKDAEPSTLVQAVELLAQRQALLSPSLTRRLIGEFTSQPQPRLAGAERLAELTAREREVMALVAHGLDNGEIAERLVVSPATARTHVSRAMVKLGARDRAQLVVLAYETGIVAAPTRAPDEAQAFGAVGS